MDEQTKNKGVIEDESRPAAAGQEDKTQTAAQPAEAAGRRIESKLEARLLVALGKLLEEGSQEDIEAYNARPLNKSLIMDASQILAFMPNNLEAKRILSRFNTTSNSCRAPELSGGRPGLQAGIYAAEQLALIIGVFNCFKQDDKHITIRLKTDAPIELENYYFKAWLAPRVESC